MAFGVRTGLLAGRAMAVMRVQGHGVMLPPAVPFASGCPGIPCLPPPLSLSQQTSSLSTGKVPQLLPVLPVQLWWRQSTHNRKSLTLPVSWGEDEEHNVLEGMEKVEGEGGKVSLTTETWNEQNQIQCKEFWDNKRWLTCGVCVKDTHQPEYPDRQK